MKQTAIDFIVKELDILHRERKEKVIDAETFFKHKGVLIQLAKEKEKKQAEWQAERMYSEEEVFKLICNFNYDLQIDECKNIKEWFEQFKKK